MVCIEKPVPCYFNPAMIRENILFSTASEDRVLFSDGYQLSQSSPWPPLYFWEICAWLLKIVYLESCLAVTNEVNSWWVIFNVLSLKVVFGRYSVINIITQHILLCLLRAHMRAHMRWGDVLDRLVLLSSVCPVLLCLTGLLSNFGNCI